MSRRREFTFRRGRTRGGGALPERGRAEKTQKGSVGGKEIAAVWETRGVIGPSLFHGFCLNEWWGGVFRLRQNSLGGSIGLYRSVRGRGAAAGAGGGPIGRWSAFVRWACVDAPDVRGGPPNGAPDAPVLLFFSGKLASRTPTTSPRTPTTSPRTRMPPGVYVFGSFKPCFLFRLIFFIVMRNKGMDGYD